MAGFLTLGLMTASFLVKNQDTKTTLQGLAGVVGSAGLMLAKDGSNQSGQQSPPAPQVVPIVTGTVVALPTQAVEQVIAPIAPPTGAVK